MELTSALAPFVITLREGVEAALVVGIVLACLSKAKQTQLNVWVYGGVAAGLVGSLLIGLLLGLGIAQMRSLLPTLNYLIEPLLKSLLGAIAIIMLSWMLVWMTQQARSLKTAIQDDVQSALSGSSVAGVSIFSLVCVAVLREGFETVIFLFTSLQPGVEPIVGAGVGLLAAVAVGLALFRWGLQIDIRQFFQVMGTLLLLIVAGLVVSACKNLDAVFAAISQLDVRISDLCFSRQSCVLGPLVWDASGILPDQQFPGILLKTLLGYRDHIYLVQLVAYAAFLGGVGRRYFRSLNGQPAGKTPEASASQ
ncbi:FTR1 family protein [Almyronema epifaneia S1]|uniref:FTR1 family protein n=2 Tax=Almyronema TaxID=3114804 RepID=A0ABW6II94_9CYAN